MQMTGLYPGSARPSEHGGGMRWRQCVLCTVLFVLMWHVGLVRRGLVALGLRTFGEATGLRTKGDMSQENRPSSSSSSSSAMVAAVRFAPALGLAAAEENETVPCAFRRAASNSPTRALAWSSNNHL